MILLPPRSTRTATLFPSPTLFRSRLLGARPQRRLRTRTQRLFPVVGHPAVTVGRSLRKPQRLAHLRHRLAQVGGQSGFGREVARDKSEEHTSELQSIMRISDAVI